jgi:hypothetical protein
MCGSRPVPEATVLIQGRIDSTAGLKPEAGQGEPPQKLGP